MELRTQIGHFFLTSPSWVIVISSTATWLLVALRSGPFHFDGQPLTKLNRATSLCFES